jgi:ketosteroid isomerase-like protein
MWPYFEDGKNNATVEKIITSGHNTVITGAFTHTAASTGKCFTTPVAMHLTLVEGKINRFHFYENTWIVSKAFTG